MRELSLTYICDSCASRYSGDESHQVTNFTYTDNSTLMEVDLCRQCEPDLSNARTVTIKQPSKPKGKPYICNTCGKSYGTQRGLNHHKTKAGHHE